MALNESDPVVRFKLDMIKAALPASSAVVFGDMYIVEGGYTAKCLEYGCERALLVDSLETPGWLEARLSVGSLRDVPTGAAHLASIFRAR